MKPGDSVKAFEEFAAARGIDLYASTPRAGMQAMLEFRAAVPCSTCSEDVLLYQWGTYDWGDGKHFQLNMTRQFIEPELKEDDAISQLRLTYKYRPGSELERLGAGNQWEDGPVDFRQFVLTSAAFGLVADAGAERVEISHSYV